MIKHFVIFTFEKDFFKEEHYKEYCKAFDKIKNAFDGIKDVKIHKNCVDRPANMDLMIEMDLEDESVLGQYLSYPLIFLLKGLLLLLRQSFPGLHLQG